jgi:hypothetical protein
LSIVIPKNEGLLLSVDPGVDITDEVVKVLRERHPVVTPAAQPSAPEATSQNDGAAQKSSRNSSSPAKSAARKAAAEEEDEEPLR